MKILIAGGCGFVGANLAIYLKNLGHEIIVVDNMSRKGTEHNHKRLMVENIYPFNLPIQYVLNYPKSIKEFGTVDVILNCSAQSRSMLGIDNPSADFYGNVETTFACLELARHFNAALIHWSTNKVYSAKDVNHRLMPLEEENRYSSTHAVEESGIARSGHANTIYGATKIASEVLINEWSELYGIPCIRNRFSCIAGPHQWGCTDQGWVALWMIHHILEKPLTYYGFQGKQARDVLHINDLCDLVAKQLNLLESGEKINEVYNVGGGPSNVMSLRECTELCQRLTGSSVRIDTEAEPRWADQMLYVSDISKVSQQFNWHPKKDVVEALSDIFSWGNSNRKQLEEFYA